MNRIDDDLDDLTLPQRPRRPDARDDVRGGLREDRSGRTMPEREFTLSTGTVLALFFGLALICAVFFGFGYSMGRKSAAAAMVNTAAADNGDVTSAPASESVNKPAAGSPITPPVPAYQGQTASTPEAGHTTAASVPKSPNAATSQGETVTVPLNDSASVKGKTPLANDDPDGKIVEGPVKPATVPATGGGGTVYVQVAAVSHQEDANSVVRDLRRRGYAVFTRTSDADKLIHVQLGPFAAKKDADAMRLRLQGDGYNAIVK